MPIGMPQKSLITVQRRELPSDFMMPQMEMAQTHYSIGYLISGDRRMITPYQQIDLHDGDMSVMPPMLYHRTFSLSDRPYINYLIKISEELAADFQRDIDARIWRDVFDQRCVSFDESNSEKARMLLADMLEVYESGADYAEELLRGMQTVNGSQGAEEAIIVVRMMLPAYSGYTGEFERYVATEYETSAEKIDDYHRKDFYRNLIVKMQNSAAVKEYLESSQMTWDTYMASLISMAPDAGDPKAAAKEIYGIELSE